MRPVSGFERPVVQWLFVALSLVLIVAAGGTAWVARRANAAAGNARAAEETGRLERQQLDAQLARERSSREALTLELARARAAGEQTSRAMPTLTLDPLPMRGATPPEPTIPTRHTTEVIELRLRLPPMRAPITRFEVTLRSWSGGAVLWMRGGLTASTVDRRPTVAVFVTGDVFPPGAYELLLSGTTPEGQKADVAAYEVSFK
jgi:hypothetical protein